MLHIQANEIQSFFVHTTVMCEIFLIHTKPNSSSVKLIKPNTSSVSARWVTGKLCICFILKFGFCLSLPSPICLLRLSLFPHLHFYLVCALPSSSPHPFFSSFSIISSPHTAPCLRFPSYFLIYFSWLCLSDPLILSHPRFCLGSASLLCVKDGFKNFSFSAASGTETDRWKEMLMRRALKQFS